MNGQHNVGRLGPIDFPLAIGVLGIETDRPPNGRSPHVGARDEIKLVVFIVFNAFPLHGEKEIALFVKDVLRADGHTLPAVQFHFRHIANGLPSAWRQAHVDAYFVGIFRHRPHPQVLFGAIMQSGRILRGTDVFSTGVRGPRRRRFDLHFRCATHHSAGFADPGQAALLKKWIGRW
jgi:hypothetical protein